MIEREGGRSAKAQSCWDLTDVSHTPHGHGVLTPEFQASEIRRLPVPLQQWSQEGASCEGHHGAPHSGASAETCAAHRTHVSRSM